MIIDSILLEIQSYNNVNAILAAVLFSEYSLFVLRITAIVLNGI